MVEAILASDAVASAVKTAPPITVTWAWLDGYDMPHLVMTLTAIYTATQLFFLIYDRFRKKHR